MTQIFLLPGKELLAQMVIFPKEVIERVGGGIKPRDFARVSYFVFEGPSILVIEGRGPVTPGIYRVHQATEFNVFAYKVMNLPEESEKCENISEFYRGPRGDQEGRSGDGDTGTAEELPRQNRKGKS